MHIKDLENIINKEGKIQKEISKHQEFKEKLEKNQIKFEILFIFASIIELISIFGLSASAIVFLKILPEIIFVLAAISIGCYIMCLVNDKSIARYVLEKITQKKLNKKGIKVDSNLYSYLKKLYIGNKKINEAYEYYQNINNEMSKELFFEEYRSSNYIDRKIKEYIYENSTEELKLNKNKLSELIGKSSLDNYDIKEISEILKYKLEEDRDAKKNKILSVFKEDELLRSEKEEKGKEIEKKALLEL